MSQKVFWPPWRSPFACAPHCSKGCGAQRPWRNRSRLRQAPTARRPAADLGSLGLATSLRGAAWWCPLWRCFEAPRILGTPSSPRRLPWAWSAWQCPTATRRCEMRRWMPRRTGRFCQVSFPARNGLKGWCQAKVRHFATAIPWVPTQPCDLA